MNENIHRIDVSRETFEEVAHTWENYQSRLLEYIHTLWDYNSRINLISRKLTMDDVKQHVFHSLIPPHLIGFSDHKFIDTGTGGGLPGIPLAISNPENTFFLHDKSTKKILALDEFIQILDLQNCETITDDLNNLKFQEPVSIISKHAFKLDDFFKRSRKINWQQAVFLKGSTFTSELHPIHHHNYKFTAYHLDAFGPFFYDKVILHITPK